MEDKPQNVEIVDDDENLKNAKNVSNFYKKMRERILDWADSRGGEKGKQTAEIILVAPDLFFLMVRLVRDSRISAVDKSILLAGITYFMTPIDIIPEGLLGPGGFLDDIVLATYILNRLVNKNKEIVLEHWEGSQSLLTYLQNVTNQAENLVGKNTLRKIKRYFNLLLKTKK